MCLIAAFFVTCDPISNPANTAMCMYNTHRHPWKAKRQALAFGSAETQTRARWWIFMRTVCLILDLVWCQSRSRTFPRQKVSSARLMLHYSSSELSWPLFLLSSRARLPPQYGRPHVTKYRIVLVAAHQWSKASGDVADLLGIVSAWTRASFS